MVQLKSQNLYEKMTKKKAVQILVHNPRTLKLIHYKHVASKEPLHNQYALKQNYCSCLFSELTSKTSIAIVR